MVFVILMVTLKYLILNTGTELKNVLSACPGQLDFSSGQVTYHSHFPDVQGISLTN